MSQVEGKSTQHMDPFTIKVLTYNIHKGFDIYHRQFVLHLVREQLQAVNVSNFARARVTIRGW
ncbi:MAG: hypothetical protein ACRESK_01380 [Gammaproteobacteria bacterium]